ncbi:hypothetical protein SPI_08493 [Niveomyces insectorum RCEF 264]|uniref:Uncharacterized protein n=1 Tax=Niveomyces insectorum RCEF 264 TaxID=1081102 RepID=A0A167N0P7_9HYPO|nr:hypothetical protein SPI_08493 [Niveomyces insectorum RCEF 264]
MLFLRCPLSGWGALAVLAASLCRASPLVPYPPPVNVGPSEELALRAALDVVAHTPHLDKRLSVDFDLSKSWSDDVLFDGSYTADNSDGTQTVSLSVTCADCYTKGTVSASLKNKLLVNPVLRLDFHGVEAQMDVGVTVSDEALYTINLFTSKTPLGLGLPGLTVGVVVYVDLVFRVSAELDMTAGGFNVRLTDGAYIEAGLLSGKITGASFKGVTARSLPVTVQQGDATLQADLRVRVECGVTGTIVEKLSGSGGEAELGVYANLVEFVTELSTTDTCALQAVEWWDLNVGAFARFDVEIAEKTFGAVPTVSTTLLTAPTETRCWLSTAAAATTTTSGTVTTSGWANASSPVTASSWANTTSPVTASSWANASIPVTASSWANASSPVTASGWANASSPVTASGWANASSSATASGWVNASSPVAVPRSVVRAAAEPRATPAWPSLSARVPARPPVPATSAPAAASVAAVMTSPPGAASTSISFTTTTYTITSCAASAVNCPTAYQREVVVTKTVAVRPVANTPKASAVTAAVAVVDVVVLVPCATPVVATFIPPHAAETAAAVKAVALAAGSGASYQNSTSRGAASPTTPSYTKTVPAAPRTSSAVVTAGAAGRMVGGSALTLAGLVAAGAFLAL